MWNAYSLLENALVSVQVSDPYRRIAMMRDLYILTLVAVFILRLSQILLILLMLPVAIPIRGLGGLTSAPEPAQACTPIGDCRDKRIHPRSQQ